MQGLVNDLMWFFNKDQDTSKIQVEDLMILVSNSVNTVVEIAVFLLLSLVLYLVKYYGKTGRSIERRFSNGGDGRKEPNTNSSTNFKQVSQRQPSGEGEPDTTGVNTPFIGDKGNRITGSESWSECTYTEPANNDDIERIIIHADPSLPTRQSSASTKVNFIKDKANLHNFIRGRTGPANQKASKAEGIEDERPYYSRPTEARPDESGDVL